MTKKLDETVHLGTQKFQNDDTLAKLFKHDVSNDKVAWYVDYYTEDAERYRVRYLADDDAGNRVMMTNENKMDRDPADLESSQWQAHDVAEWFALDGSTVQHRFIFLFQHASGETYGIHCEAYRVFAFGPSALSLGTSNFWDDYVENGILGPIRGCAAFDQSELSAIIVDPYVYGHLDMVGLLPDYFSALAAVLDS